MQIVIIILISLDNYQQPHCVSTDTVDLSCERNENTKADSVTSVNLFKSFSSFEIFCVFLLEVLVYGGGFADGSFD